MYYESREGTNFRKYERIGQTNDIGDRIRDL
jgi:hypothetical protein